MKPGCFAIALAVFASSVPAASLCPDSFEMRVIARLPVHLEYGVACGDADHNGMREVYAIGEDTLDEWTVVCAEHIGGGQFEYRLPGMERQAPWVVSDMDGDGRGELVTRAGLYLRVYEAPDGTSLPCNLVWADTLNTAFANRVIASDLDADSALDITGIFNRSPYEVWVYESRGDDEYARVVRLHTPPVVPGVPVDVAQARDMDRDGWPELVVVTDDDCVGFYEAVADDSMELKATHEPGNWNGAQVVGTPDMDQDGRPEAVVMGVDVFGVATVCVYEAPCDDSFELVWTTQVQGGYNGNWRAVSGDVDGDSVFEFALADGGNLRLFRCTGPDEYAQFWSIDYHMAEVQLYDIDADGKDELIHRDGQLETVIRKHVEVGVAERELRGLQGVRVVPSVARPGVAVRMDGLESGFSVQVLDAAGRVVAEPGDGVWRTDGVSPGVYFFRFGPSAASCQPSAVSARKLLLVE